MHLPSLNLCCSPTLVFGLSIACRIPYICIVIVPSSPRIFFTLPSFPNPQPDAEGTSLGGKRCKLYIVSIHKIKLDIFTEVPHLACNTSQVIPPSKSPLCWTLTRLGSSSDKYAFVMLCTTLESRIENYIPSENHHSLRQATTQPLIVVPFRKVIRTPHSKAPPSRARCRDLLDRRRKTQGRLGTLLERQN